MDEVSKEENLVTCTKKSYSLKCLAKIPHYDVISIGDCLVTSVVCAPGISLQLTLQELVKG